MSKKPKKDSSRAEVVEQETEAAAQVHDHDHDHDHEHEHENEHEHDDSGAGTPDEDAILAELMEKIDVGQESVGSLRVKLTVTVPRDILDSKMDEQFRDLRREAVVPGFRRGHAPIRLVEKRFAAEVGDQLKGQMVGQGYLAAVKKLELKPLGDPLVWVTVDEDRQGEDGVSRKVKSSQLLPLERALDHVTLPKEGSLTFACEVELRPEFELPKLDKIPLKRPKVEVTDAHIEEEIRRVRMIGGTFEPVEEGAVELDDMVYADLKMVVDGEMLLNEQNIDLAARDLRIKGVPMVGLGEALKGKRRGEEATLEAIVPDDHERADLRGKTARFDMTVREIKRLRVPPIDEAFLKSFGMTSEEEFRKLVRERLDSRLDDMVKESLHHQVADYLVENTKIEIPEGLSQRQTERTVMRRMIEMLRNGVPEAEVSKAMDTMRASAHDRAVRDLKVYFILEKVFEDDEVEVTEEEINGAIAAIARQTQKRFDRVRDDLSRNNGLMGLYLQLRDQKLLDRLVANAEVVEAEPAKAESAPKKKKN